MSTSSRSETLRARLWFWPAVAGAASALLTLLLTTVRPAPGTAWATAVWPGGQDAASTVLQVVATSIMTATTLTFSLTVVALQLASQQFSPRLLREFARDAKIQAVLAVLVSTFVIALTGLAGMGSEAPLPVLVPALTLVMGLVSAGALVMFLGHIVRSLRVDSMMVAVHEQAAATVAEAYLDYEDRSKEPAPGLPGPEGGTLLRAKRSGFVQAIRPGPLVEACAEHGLFLLLGVRPGDHVTEGTPLGSVWTDDGAPAAAGDVLDEAVAQAVEVGFERTLEHDAALGLRQLTDIAVKAISPSVNDPITAHAIGYCTDLLARLQHRKLGPQQHVDAAGTVRLVTPDRDHRYYLDLVCAPIRRFGAGEPLVLTALLRMLRACAATARDDTQHAQIAHQTELLLQSMDPGLIDSDAEEVREFAGRVHLALSGDLDDAFRDRAGETRSV
ncbi:DUF2254 domain-containing protein [Kocuria turfanensis]|uniref:DUF2254 domain-containing protein n=1 Tax=Kocuria turfanensis TaxID=388357 RepID=UPI0007897F57|nr:DUF2254 domain-containing protein [Kocuria turfanensis]